ncbi:MAG: ATP-dependent helicase [Actinomycetota bacterium]
MTAVTRPDEQPYEGAPPEIVHGLGGRVPTVQQWQAISHPMTPCCIIAGAGSGKTAVMAARVVYLAMVATGRIAAVGHAGAMPSSVLCLTFTNKAAEELSRRVRDATAALGLPEGEEPTVLTYHAFAARLLDEYGLRAGIQPGAMLLTEAQKWQLVSSLLADREFEYLEVRTVPYTVRQVLLLADECQNHLVDPDDLIAASRALTERQEVRNAADRDMLVTAQRRIEMAEMVREYQARKREIGAIDYGDQIRLAVDLATDHPEVREEFRARFGAVLLDEYQDTNIAQARLLHELCGDGYPVTAVGDPDQNIYAWRGASLRNILRFAGEFGGPDRDATQLPLFVNFRSGSRILAVADAVIGEVPEDRRAGDKELRPHPSRGEGRVLSFVAEDERDEARRIAALIRDHVDTTGGSEPAWRDVAVLCRKKRLFPAIAEVLREEGIPVEIVDLGGLLKMPEVVDVVAWLRLIDDPARNVALARLLQGPRWRIGYRDMAAMAAWSARNNARLRGELPGEVDRPGDVAFALAEALDHLDDEDMTGVSDEARERLREFRAELATLREEARGPLGDLVAAVVERSGVLREIEASSSPASEGVRLNLLNLIDHVAAFAPVDGEASLSTLVAYLDVAEETEDELEPAQPSEANTVKLLTIHKAKGLEWPVVFVPGMAACGTKSMIFPDTSRQPNPVKQQATLPFELRGDADVLPRYEGNINAFKAALTERGLEEERRLCYVALTRARDTLVVSSSYWYEGPSDSYEPSTFYREVSAHEACEVVHGAACPEVNPLVEAIRARTRRWPPAARVEDADTVFPEGWHAAAEEAVADPEAFRGRATAALDAGELQAVQGALDEHLERAELIRERTRPSRRLPLPAQLSVSSVIDYVRCPKLFYWSQVRPLPRRSSPAARLGTEIHRWVELQSRGQATLIDLDELPDLSVEERLGEAASPSALKDAYRASRFAGMTPLYAERPFLLYLDGMVIGGRIDAVYGSPDGPWEVVDYKTGRRPSDDDPITGLQLDLYALACVEVWHKRPEDLKLTYFYLRSGDVVTRTASGVDETRERVRQALRSIAAGEFDPVPGEQCGWCDFLAFCEAGQKFVSGG